MRAILFNMAFAAVTLVLLPAAAGVPDNAPADSAAAAAADVPASEIKAPWKYAPSEQVIAGRDTMDFRKEGSLLSKMSREIPTVDVAALAERKLAMYDGERFLRGPVREDGPRAPIHPADRPRSVEDDEGTLRFGWLGWTLAGVLVVGVVVVWRLGWFVPFSARDRREHVLQAASAAKQSRAVKKPGPSIAPAKRDG